MGMDLDTSGGRHKGGRKKKRPNKPSINVTPLVDVVLVLLIIFMVVTPLMTKKLSVNVPVKGDENQQPAEPEPDEEPQVILMVKAGGEAFINREQVDDAELATKLQRVFAVRDDQTLFFDAAGQVDYGRAMEILDLARGAGIMTIAVLTEDVASES